MIDNKRSQRQLIVYKSKTAKGGVRTAFSSACYNSDGQWIVSCRAGFVGFLTNDG